MIVIHQNPYKTGFAQDLVSFQYFIWIKGMDFIFKIKLIKTISSARLCRYAVQI